MQDTESNLEPLERFRSPREILETDGKYFKPAWRIVDRLREQRGCLGFADWPEWCFLPRVLWTPVWREAGLAMSPQELAYLHEMLPVLGTWRVTQGAYRFEPTLFDALCNTPVIGEVPCEVLLRLPEWCVYIMTPGLHVGPAPMHGAFALLDWDFEAQCPCLLILMNLANETLLQICVTLMPRPFEQLLDEAFAGPMRLSGENAERIFATLDSSSNNAGRAALERVISLLLFMCTQNAELSSCTRRPQNPAAKRTAKGMRTFPAERTTTWEVGTRLGSALRAARARATTEAANACEGTHARPRAHIRRAHYHHYLTGPRESSTRQLVLKWLPPIPVNVGRLEDLPTTIRTIEAANDPHQQAA